MKAIFNMLQLFAEVINTTTSVPVETDHTFWQTALIKMTGPKLVHDQFAQKVDIPEGGSQNIEFRRLNALPTDVASNVLTEGVTPDGQALSIEKISAKVAQYGNYIKNTDMLEATAKDDVMDLSVTACSDQGAAVSDKVTRDVMHQCTVSFCASGIASTDKLTASTYLDPDDLFKAAALLEAANAPTIDGYYVAIVHPLVAKDLMSKLGGTTAWTDVMKYADPSKILNGEIGTYGKVRVVTTTHAKFYKAGELSGAAAGVGVFATIVVGRNAYGATKITGMGMELITHNKGEIGGALNQFSTVGWKNTKAAEILVDQYMVKIYSTASQVPAASN